MDLQALIKALKEQNEEQSKALQQKSEEIEFYKQKAVHVPEILDVNTQQGLHGLFVLNLTKFQTSPRRLYHTSKAKT
jgi:hypothetical protein